MVPANCPNRIVRLSIHVLPRVGTAATFLAAPVPSRFLGVVDRGHWRPRKPVVGRIRPREERFHLAPQLIVAGARARQIRGARGTLVCARGFEQVFDLLPAFGRHAFVGSREHTPAFSNAWPTRRCIYGGRASSRVKRSSRTATSSCRGSSRVAATLSRAASRASPCRLTRRGLRPSPRR